jgi:PAS domain S-box-containing protein
MESTGKTSSRSNDQTALLESAERAAQVGSWEWIPETGAVRWSDNHFRLFGLEPGAITPSTALVREMTHPDDRVRLRREVERVAAGASQQRFEYRIIRADGALRHMRSTMVGVEEDGRIRRVLGSIHDITDQRRAESQIAAHVAVSEALADWETFDHGMENLLRQLAVALDCAAGALWVAERDSLSVRSFWRSDTLENGEAFETTTRKLSLGRGKALAGRVWETGAPVAVQLAEQPGFIRLNEANAAGLRSALAFPVLAGAETLAVLELYSADDAAPSERLMRSLVGIGHELGQFLLRRRGELAGPPLTPRELEVLKLAAGGNSRPQIAELLTISPATVKSHFEHVYAKLGVSDRAAAVGKAVREGLIE